MTSPEQRAPGRGPLRVVVGHDDVIGGVLDTISERVTALGGSVIRIPSGAGTASSRLTPEDLETFFGDADIAVVSSRTIIDRHVLDAAPRLRGLVFPSVGVNSCDLDAATDHRVLVTNGPTAANIQSMAESQVLAMLALLYRLEEKQRAFERADALALPMLRKNSRMLAGRTLGFIGYGRITRAVIERLQGWGLGDVVVHTRTAPQRPEAEPGTPRFLPLDEVLRIAEVLCVNTTLTKSTAGLLNQSRLHTMRPGALLLVQSRGGIVDEEVVAAMLADGSLAGAAIDTFAQEPPPLSHPLRVTTAVLTNHNIGHTAEMFASFPSAAVAAVSDLANTTVPASVVNESVISAWLSTWRAINWK